jgi:hypothetical protein
VDGFAHKLEKYISKAAVKEEKGGKGAKDKGAKDKGGKQEVDFSKRPPVSSYVLPATLPPPSTDVTQATAAHSAGMGSLFSSSLISQSDDPEDQTVLVFPDWKVCLEVENSQSGAKGMWEGVLEPKLGRAGRLLAEEGGTERRRSWVLPYRAVILLCMWSSLLLSLISLRLADSWRFSQAARQAVLHRRAATAQRPGHRSVEA